MFTLLLCLAAGITPIITSSSDAKLENIRKLSPEILTLNYKTTPDMPAEVLRLTDGKGADYIVNNVGPTAIKSQVKMLRNKGSIALVGLLGSKHGEMGDVYWDLLLKAGKFQ